MSEYHKVDLYKRLTEAKHNRNAGLEDFYVDDFENVNLLTKEFIDRSIWVAPMPKGMLG